MYYYTQFSYLWKNEIYHQADVLIWRRTGLRCNGKETDKKRGGVIWCVLLKIALPYVADNKKKFTNKSANSLQSVCYYQSNKEQGVLGNRWHCPSDNKKNRLAFKWYFYCLSLGCFSLSSRLFRYQIASVSCCVCVSVSTFNFVFLFMLSLFCECSIVTCICVFEIFNVNSASSLDEPFRLLEQML